MAAEKRILIVGPSWVGDMVMAHSLIQLLGERHRGALIDVLAPAWSRPLLDRMPGVRAAIDMPVGHGELALGERMRLGESLRGQYDQAIVLPNSLKSSLVPFFAGIRTRTGWRGEMRFWLLNDIRLLNKKRYPLMVQRFNALAFAADFANPVPAPFPVLQVRAEGIPDLLARFGLNTRRPVLALCPGAEFGPAKRWPEGHYGAVAAAAVARGWQVWVFGSANDRAVAEALVAGAGEAAEHCHILAGETALAEAIDLLSVAGAVVSNDSGLMHIAAWWRCTGPPRRGSHRPWRRRWRYFPSPWTAAPASSGNVPKGTKSAWWISHPGRCWTPSSGCHSPSRWPETESRGELCLPDLPVFPLRGPTTEHAQYGPGGTRPGARCDGAVPPLAR